MKRLLIHAAIPFFLANSAMAADFTVTSPQLKDGETMPMEQVLNGFGCTGANISPELNWENGPEGTKSYAVTVYDPDAPTGSGWWHWIAFNIPSNATGLPTNASVNPEANGMTQSRTDFGTSGYGGACPPEGDTPHRYQFMVWALDTDHIDLDAEASGAMVGYFLNMHKLGKAELTVKFGR
ncbi:YbhB/YbcL family Raf kinase inhibitor-like protein [Desulforhopalus sp. 52FAK]